MAFVPPLFGKLGKDCGDLLKKKYDFKNSVTSKYATSQGVPLNFEINGDITKDLSGSLKTTYKDKSFGEIEGSVGTVGKLGGSIKLDKLVDGLSVTTKGSTCPDMEGSIAAEYRMDNLSASAELALPKSSLVASGVIGTAGLSFGFKTKACLQTSAFKDFDVACQYEQADFVFTAASEKKGDLVTASLYHTVSKSQAVGAKITCSPLAEASKQISMTVGCQHKLDADTTLKAKLDSAGVLCTALEHSLMGPNLKVNFAAQFNYTGKNTLTADKFGVGLTFGK
jgi:hypothetical protein